MTTDGVHPNEPDEYVPSQRDPSRTPSQPSGHIDAYGISHHGSGSIAIRNAAVGPGATINVGIPATFQQAADELAQEHAATHAEAAASIRWITQQATVAQEPAEARDRVSTIKDAGPSVWARFRRIVEASAPSLARWLPVLVENVARW